jgi:hypothetical protein
MKNNFWGSAMEETLTNIALETGNPRYLAGKLDRYT